MTVRGVFIFPLAGVLTSAVVAGCGEGRGQAPVAAIAANAVAVVGNDSIGSDTVARIAGAQSVGSRAALELAVGDALIAAAARERLGDAAVRQASRAALARTLLESFADESRRKGPPTDAEVAEATAKRWWELDRPRLLRVTHVVVRTKEGTDDAKAHALANRIAAKVAGLTDPESFKAAARSVPADGLEVTAEDLPPMAPDGTMVDVSREPPPPPAGKFIAAFVDAALAIPGVKHQSPVVHTQFGYHVILAVESIPPHQVPLEERRTLLAGEITNGRAAAMSQAALAHAKSLDVVAVERSAVDTMLLVQTGP